MALIHRLLGKAARLVWRVTRPRTIGVRAVLLDANDRIALVRHSYIDGWYLPGGGVKKGEAIVDALHRELVEEVAIEGAVVERVLGSIIAVVRARTTMSWCMSCVPGQIRCAAPIGWNWRRPDGSRRMRCPRARRRRRGGGSRSGGRG
jgi:8-oxo-dGTP pyrophosphatase MutT (NUDIX family)